MLFDLRSRGRRRTVKIVYVTLAVLMGGGLVGFGIGGDVQGGIADIFTSGNASSGDVSERFEQREAAALARTRANSRDEAAWVELIRARTQLAGQGDNVDAASGNYTDQGRAKLREAAQAWERYIALEPRRVDTGVAGLMVQAYSALGQVPRAVAAQEIVTEARPNVPGPFSTLAVLAWQAGQIRKGDLARDRVLELTDRDRREAVRGELEQAKSQATGAAAGAAGGGTPAAPAPTAAP